MQYTPENTSKNMQQSAQNISKNMQKVALFDTGVGVK